MKTFGTKVGCWAGMLGLIVLTAPARAQQLGHGSEVDVSGWRVLAGLGFILILVVGVFLVARLRPVHLTLWRSVSARRLKVIETTRLSPQATLCLASCDGKEYLIALTSGSVSVIDTPTVATDGQ
jgi:flagellar biogenesis protein FliO